MKIQTKDAYLRIAADSTTDLLLVSVLKIKKSCFQVLVLLGNASHVTEGAPVDIIDADDVRVVTQRLKDRSGGGRTRSKGEGVCTTGFERCQRPLQCVSIGVPRSRVFKSLIRSAVSSVRIPFHGAIAQPYLVVSNAVLLVCRAQGDGRYDCPSAWIWVRPDVNGACAKAVECLPRLLRPIQVGRSVDGGSQGDRGHDGSLWGFGGCEGVGPYFVIVATFLYGRCWF